MLSASMTSTIAARSTPAGKGALAVVRMSGPDCKQILKKITRSSADPTKTPRRMVYSLVVDSKGNRIDDVLVVYFVAPHSYTGEDMSEIHCHGGEAVVQVVMNLLIEAGATAAERGEFTRRAFINDKMDLSKAEAVIKIIESGSRAQLYGAQRAAAGELSKKLMAIKEELLDVLAETEANIDFHDEKDVKKVELKQFSNLRQTAKWLEKTVSKEVDSSMEVVVAGKPNVGKSSLVNALAEKKVSIVTEEPGTTRDAVSCGIYLGGFKVTLVDTAGTDDQDQVGLAAIAAEILTQNKVKNAAMLVWVTDNPKTKPPELKKKCPMVWVVNKVDLIPDAEKQDSQLNGEKSRPYFVSAKLGDGIKYLRDHLAEMLTETYGEAEAIPVSLRQHAAINVIISSINAAERETREQRPELASEDIKLAIRGVEELLGQGIKTEVLDRIFEKFCIGK